MTTGSSYFTRILRSKWMGFIEVSVLHVDNMLIRSPQQIFILDSAPVSWRPIPLPPPNASPEPENFRWDRPIDPTVGNQFFSFKGDSPRSSPSKEVEKQYVTDTASKLLGIPPNKPYTSKASYLLGVARRQDLLDRLGPKSLMHGIPQYVNVGGKDMSIRNFIPKVLHQFMSTLLGTITYPHIPLPAGNFADDFPKFPLGGICFPVPWWLGLYF